MSEGAEKNGISSATVDLAVEGSSRMAAYVARAKALGRHPGLMVFQEAYGVNHHIRDVTERFAAQGYVAIAPELFHRTAPKGFEGD
jgi:carboxymethylenebutenolidase